MTKQETVAATPLAPSRAIQQPLSRNFLQKLAEDLPLPVAVLLGAEHRYCFANHSYRAWFLSGSDPVGRMVKDVLPEACAPGLTAALDRVLQTGETYHGAESGLASDGCDTSSHHVRCRTSYQAFRDGEGTVQGVIATVVHVAKREEELEATMMAHRTLAADRDNVRRLFVDSDHFFISWRAPHFVYEFSNPVSDRIVGCNPLGRPVHEVVPSARESGLLALLDEVIASGKPKFVREFPVFVAGQERFFEATYIPRKNEHGAVDGIMALGLDITQRVCERRKLKQSECDLARAVEVAKVGFYDWVVANNVINLSKICAEMYQVGQTSSVDRMLEVVHPDDRERVGQIVQASLETGADYYAQHRVLRRDNTTIWVEAMGEITKDESGNPSHFFGTIRDITELKEATNLLATQQHLNESVIAQSPAGIALLRGADLVVAKHNENWCTFAPVAGQIGRSVKSHLRDAAGVNHGAALSEVFHTAKTLRLKEVKVRIDGGPKAGALRIFDVAASQVRDGSGRPFGVVCQANDVSEDVLAREALKENLAALQAERELRERFVATLTHDMRTPLAAAKMSAEQLLRRPKDQAASKRLAQRIVRCIGRCEAMVQNLLDANRLKAGEKLHIKLAPCSLNELVAQSIDELSMLHGRQFKLRATGEVITGLVDQDAVRRIIDNLGGNAVKYGDKDRPITIGLGWAAGCVTLWVHNEGPPIASAEQETLFDAYSRSSTAIASGQKGWGIGLSLVKGLTEAHGGHVEVRSAKGEGTTFRLTLPGQPQESCTPPGTLPSTQGATDDA